MSVEREMSLVEWCAKLPNQHKVNQELAVLNKQLAALAEQNEKLTEAYDQCGRTVQDYGRTIDQTESRLREVATHCANVEQQLAALAEQNEKLKEAINLIYSWANNWESEFMNDPDWKEQDYPFIQSTISLPDLASPVLNRVKAEALRDAADEFDAQGEWKGHGQQLRKMADDIEKGEALAVIKEEGL